MTEGHYLEEAIKAARKSDAAFAEMRKVNGRTLFVFWGIMLVMFMLNMIGMVSSDGIALGSVAIFGFALARAEVAGKHFGQALAYNEIRRRILCNRGS